MNLDKVKELLKNLIQFDCNYFCDFFCSSLTENNKIFCQFCNLSATLKCVNSVQISFQAHLYYLNSQENLHDFSQNYI